MTTHGEVQRPPVGRISWPPSLILLHYDSDFDQIAAVTGQACEWVVPAGSVD
jgi:hypothetical protein